MKHLEADNKTVQRYRLSYPSPGAYPASLKMGRTGQLTMDQVTHVKILHHGAALFAAGGVSSTYAGAVEKELPIRQNDVYFVAIKQITK